MSVSEAGDTMAVFLDLENVAPGASESFRPDFDIRKVLDRLLLRGRIVAKRAYCDFDRYKAFKRELHEAAFELIEIPHISQSGKNSADIHLVVDALDLNHARSHIDTFVIIGGDSDFSPLVNKLRESNKTVVGIGLRKSTSRTLVTLCDEFLYYEDITGPESAAEPQPGRASATSATAASAPAVEAAMNFLTKTLEGLSAETEGAIWASVLKNAMKRTDASFNERALGFRSFSEMLEEAQTRGRLALEPKEKVGGYRVRTLK